MLRIAVLLLFIAVLAGCKGSGKKTENSATKENTVTELTDAGKPCLFDNPDTSLSNMVLRNSQSAESVLQQKDLLGDTSYLFFSKDKMQVLEVNVHPGDGVSQVSIFKVRNASAGVKATPTGIGDFVTEKGIKLGLTKAELTSLLGNCYLAADSSASSLTLNYRLETPQDTKTGFLKSQNMPIYYAVYKFINDKLSEFEFGFEYP